MNDDKEISCENCNYYFYLSYADFDIFKGKLFVICPNCKHGIYISKTKVIGDFESIMKLNKEVGE